MKKRILCVLLSALMLFGVLAMSAGAIVAQNPVHKESGTVEGKADDFPAIRDGLIAYQVGETKTMADDGYIGIPVDITVYNDSQAFSTPKAQDELQALFETSEPNPVKLSATGKPLILYVINTNTVRYGTDSDVDIITDLLSQGYVVMVVDYKNEKRAATPDLDWSLQLVRTQYATYTGSIEIWDGYNYILPAGYSLKRGVQFFNYEMSAVDGILDYITEIWNVDLKRTSGDYARGNTWTVIWGQKELYDGTLVYQDADGNRCIRQGDGYAYYTQNADYSYTVGETVQNPTAVTPLYKKVSDDAVWKNEQTREIKIRYAIAEDFWDCVKTNGDRIDLNLYADIAYPTNPKDDVPVMMLASSSELRSKSTQTATRPISTGFMFTGYAFVNYDHAYTPMARTDHLGYFEGDTDTRRTAFTLRYHTGVQAQTAAVRMVRAMADLYPELFSFNVNAIGAWGHSKGAAVNLLGTANPELQPNEEFLPAHSDECSGEQQWLTYQNGNKIPSGVNLVYTSNGGGTYFIYEDNVPTVVTQGEDDGTFSNNTHMNLILNALRSLDVPAFDMSMEGVGHTTIYGYNEERDYDMYQALFDFCDYHLYGRASVCEYILPKNGTTGVGVGDDITVKFTGPIPEWEITDKVKVIHTVTGESVDGWWESAFGGNEWTFHPTGLEGGTVYTVLVPETVVDENGNAIKARKSVSFRTKYDTAFSAVSVESTNGSFTLTGSAEGKNGIYFEFPALNITDSFGTTLRFSVTNAAATALRVYGIRTEGDEDYKDIPLGEPIATVGVGGREIVEVDVSEFIASLTTGQGAVFYIEADREAGETTFFESDFNEADTRGLFSGATFAQSPNGTEAIRINMGGSVSASLFPNGIAEADYGRMITITFDIYSTIDRPVHARMRLNTDKVLENGKYFVDLYNDAYTVIDLKAGQWQRVSLTYRIDNHDYVKYNIQKTRFTVATAGNSISGEYVYIDNMQITETVTDATVAHEDMPGAMMPTLAIKDAEIAMLSPVQGGYVVSGQNEGLSFDGKDGYLVSGPESGMQGDVGALTYLAVDISTLDASKPYALTLNILGGTGTLLVYAIAPRAIAEDFDISRLNYLNAPALDRAAGKMDENDTLGGAPLGEYPVFSGSDCLVGLTTAILDLKARGEDTLLLAVVADAETTTGEITFRIKTSGSLETTLSFLDFTADSFLLASRRADNVYDTCDVYMQGNYTAQEAMENEGVTADSTVFYGTGGTSMKIVVPSGSYNVYKFLKLIESPDFSFTTADIGKTYSVSFMLYPTTEITNVVKVGMSTVAAGATDGSAANKLCQPLQVKNLKANEWNTISYSFVIEEAMVGGRFSKITSDTRPINFCIQGLRDTTVYVDDMRFFATQSADTDFRATSRTENTFDSSTDAKKVLANGFESFKDENGTTQYRTSYSTLANFTEGGKGSLRILHNKSYNRFFLTGLIDAADMTAQNIGDTYSFTFRIKSDKAGTIKVSVAKKSHNTSTAAGFPVETDFKITEENVGEWVTFTYTFTVNQAIVDDLSSGTSNEGFGFRFRFTGFGALSDGSIETCLFLDDAVCYRNTNVSGGIFLGTSAENTANGTFQKPDALTVSSPSTVEGVKKSYFEYDLTGVKDIHGASLVLRANAHQGQQFRLYGLVDVAFPENLTYLNAPACGKGAEMLLDEVWGGKAIASFSFAADSSVTLDLYDFISENLGKKVIFVLVAEDGSLSYLNLDFSFMGSTVQNCITSDGALSLEDGVLATDGTSITVKNAFASGEATLPAFAPITVSATVSGKATTYTVALDGTDFCASVSAKDGKISCTFIPEVDTKASSLTVTASESGFALENLKVSSPRVANLASPVLNLYLPSTPTYEFDNVILSHNVVIASSLSYNLYLATDKGIVSVKVGDKVISFASLPDYITADATYKQLTLDTVAKDAFVNQYVEITLADGSTRIFEINIQRYLEQYYTAAATNEEKALAANMISYLAQSALYFYRDSAVAKAAEAVRDTVLGKGYDAKHPETALNALEAIGLTEDSGMKGAGLSLAERPTFYFILADGEDGTDVSFTVDGVAVSYTTQLVDGDTYYILKQSPDTLFKTVSYTVSGKSGTFNLKAYYNYAKDNDIALATLIERLSAYVESVHTVFEE